MKEPVPKVRDSKAGISNSSKQYILLLPANVIALTTFWKLDPLKTIVLIAGQSIHHKNTINRTSNS